MAAPGGLRVPEKLMLELSWCAIGFIPNGAQSTQTRLIAAVTGGLVAGGLWRAARHFFRAFAVGRFLHFFAVNLLAWPAGPAAAPTDSTSPVAKAATTAVASRPVRRRRLRLMLIRSPLA